MKKALRVMHLANIALGNPYIGLPLDLCRECYERFPEVFDELFDYIKREEIDLVLIAGNLYGRYLMSGDTAHLMRKMEEAKPCIFVIAPGAEDPCTTDSLYKSGRFPDNVLIFEKDTLDRFDLPELGATVYGWAVLSQRRNVNPLLDVPPASPDRINLIATGSLDAPIRAQVKIRYAHTPADATVTQTGADSLHVEFDAPQRAVAPGQSVVIYDGDTVIGGGIIR